MATLRDKFDTYFATLNGTSGRMMADLASYKQCEGWNDMTEDEKTRILWKCLVSDAEKKYGTASGEANKSFPVLDIKPGEKIVIDEDTSNGRPFGCSWRDEHSSPFSWETKSQLNLQLLGGEIPKVPPKVPPRVSSRPDRVKPSVPPPSVPTPSVATNPVTPAAIVPPAVPPPPPPSVAPSNVSFLHPATPKAATSPASKDPKPPKSIQKPKAPPPCPPVRSSSAKPTPQLAAPPTPPDSKATAQPTVSSKSDHRTSHPVPDDKKQKASQNLGSQSSLQSPTKSIPKTGFDFLDNW